MASVGIDATGWLNSRGFGRFTRNLVSRLVERESGLRWVLYADSRTCELGALPDTVDVRPVALRQTPARAAAADSRRGVEDILRLSWAASRDRLDLFLFCSVYTYFPVARTPTVVGVHDTIARDMPDLTLRTSADRIAWNLKEDLAVRRARTVFTVSAASRQRVARQFRLQPADIPVVPEAADPVFRPRAPAEAAQTLEGLDLRPGRYLVYAGGISPHKNIETLVEAYARLDAGEAGPLVLVGDLAGNPYLSAAKSVRAKIAELGLEGRVRLPGFVADEALAHLFGGCALAVFPSLAEGFGLPAVEAAACGAAVVASDLAAHRESLGDAAAYFEPNDTDGLAALLRELIGAPERRRELAGRARTAAAALSWERAAEELEAVLRRSLEA